MGVAARLEFHAAKLCLGAPRGKHAANFAGSSAQESDDAKIGYDNNADADILDAGDDIHVDNDFGSNVLSLSYDTAGDQGGSPKANASGSDTTAGFYYSGWGSANVSFARWSICETRNGSTQATFQHLGGLGGVGVPPAGCHALAGGMGMMDC